MECLHLKIYAKNVEKNLHGAKGHFMVFSILNHIPDLINMTKMIPEPIVWEVTKDKGIPGFSGIMPIMESHVTIHTFSETGEYFADIFSCKDFNVLSVVDYLNSVYGGSIEYGVEVRGDTRFREAD